MAPSVLLVDSDADSIAIYSMILRHHGFEVMAARDASTGFRLAVERRPDVVVTEIFLAPWDGRSVADLLRGDTRTAMTPLILLDSVPVFGDQYVEALKPAARLTKPCEPSRLVAEVERLLGLEAGLPAS